MNDWKRAARQAMVSGTAASLLSTAALAIAGKRENDAPAGPINGSSPRRLKPGFDAQISKKSLFAVYAAFAVGLTIYEATRRRGR